MSCRRNKINRYRDRIFLSFSRMMGPPFLHLPFFLYLFSHFREKFAPFHQVLFRLILLLSFFCVSAVASWSVRLLYLVEPPPLWPLFRDTPGVGWYCPTMLSQHASSASSSRLCSHPFTPRPEAGRRDHPLRLVSQDWGHSARFLVAFDSFLAFDPGYAGIFVSSPTEFFQYPCLDLWPWCGCPFVQFSQGWYCRFAVCQDCQHVDFPALFQGLCYAA